MYAHMYEYVYMHKCVRMRFCASVVQTGTSIGRYGIRLSAFKSKENRVLYPSFFENEVERVL